MAHLHRRLKKKSGRGWTRTIGPLVNTSRSLLSTRPLFQDIYVKV